MAIQDVVVMESDVKPAISPTKNNYLASVKIAYTVNIPEKYRDQKFLRYHFFNRIFHLFFS
jgi:hypothetical protein